MGKVEEYPFAAGTMHIGSVDAQKLSLRQQFGEDRSLRGGRGGRHNMTYSIP